MAAMAAHALKPVVGSAKPRVAPPTPIKHDLPAFRATAEGMGLTLMPWQETAAKYLTATGANGRRLHSEVAIVVARQNGKTTLMKPYIIAALRDGKKVMHIAQTRELPRHMFGVIADALAKEPELFPKRRGKVIWPRYGAGQEEIQLLNGGQYRIAAANTGGARGWSNDIVIIDELREMTSFDIINAAEPTLVMSLDPQIVYLSNAGTESSVVLNTVKDRAAGDPNLAYLEWSAGPDREPDDIAGWREANPALGHYPSVLTTLEKAYTRHKLGGTLATFETEHLCRWVISMRERLVDDKDWQACQVEDLGNPQRPVMAVSMSPDGRRASAAIAWQRGERVALRLLFDVTGDPVPLADFGTDLKTATARMGLRKVGFDNLTDKELAKFFPIAKPVSGAEYANASARFATLVKEGKLEWDAGEAITNDLVWTARKAHDESGSFQAVRASDERPITAALAAIRAVWLASGPRLAQARVY